MLPGMPIYFKKSFRSQATMPVHKVNMVLTPTIRDSPPPVPYCPWDDLLLTIDLRPHPMTLSRPDSNPEFLTLRMAGAAWKRMPLSQRGHQQRLHRAQSESNRGLIFIATQTRDSAMNILSWTCKNVSKSINILWQKNPFLGLLWVDCGSVVPPCRPCTSVFCIDC